MLIWRQSMFAQKVISIQIALDTVNLVTHILLTDESSFFLGLILQRAVNLHVRTSLGIEAEAVLILGHETHH